MTTIELEELFNSLYHIEWLWHDENLHASTKFLSLTSKVPKKDLLNFLEPKIYNNYRRTISFIVPIIGESIYFRNYYYNLNYFENPFKYLKDPNNNKVDMVKNIIREFYIKS